MHLHYMPCFASTFFTCNAVLKAVANARYCAAETLHACFCTRQQPPMREGQVSMLSDVPCRFVNLDKGQGCVCQETSA